jgi:pimeloyl-ACP methyl ester carboxylesterase
MAEQPMAGQPMAEPAQAPEHWVEVGDATVHYVDLPGPSSGPTYVLVHGLGGALTNWDSLAPLLAERGRVIALDLGGFGLTRAVTEGASVESNQRLLDGFLRALDLPPVVLIGNSMGGMLAALHAARAPETVAELVLVDPALPGHPRHRPHPLVLAVFGVYLVPPLGRRMLRARADKITPERAVRDTFKLVTHDITRVPTWLLDRHVRLAKARVQEFGDEAAASFLIAARSVVTTVLRRPAYVRALSEIRCPVLLLHGAHDRLVNVRAARAAAAQHPTWTYAEGQDVGHCPMFEDPEWVRDHIVAFLAAAQRT